MNGGEHLMKDVKKQRTGWKNSKANWRAKIKEEGGLPYFNERARHANKRVRTQYGIVDKVTGEELMLLYELDHACTECHIDLKPAEVEFDHTTSLKAGGKHHISNINIKCQKCNKRKGTK